MKEIALSQNEKDEKVKQSKERGFYDYEKIIYKIDTVAEQVSVVNTKDQMCRLSNSDDNLIVLVRLNNGMHETDFAYHTRHEYRFFCTDKEKYVKYIYKGYKIISYNDSPFKQSLSRKEQEFCIENPLGEIEFIDTIEVQKIMTLFDEKTKYLNYSNYHGDKSLVTFLYFLKTLCDKNINSLSQAIKMTNNLK